MEKMVGFVKLYFPVFLLGAVFGKVIELSGFSESIVAAAIRYIGKSRVNAVIVAVCALLTYGGVSLFVVVFAVYPFAAEMYRQSNIPKRLMPGSVIALGAFSFTMDSLPGTPQIQNIIPTTFFKTTGWAAPWLGVIGSVFIIVVCLSFLEWRRRSAMATGKGYGTSLVNEPERVESTNLPNPALAFAPLILVGVANFALTKWIPVWYGANYTVAPEVLPGVHAPVATAVKTVVAIWAVEGALLFGIVLVLLTAFSRMKERFAVSSLRGHHGLGVGRHEHRARGDVRYLHRWRTGRAYSARGAAPGSSRWQAAAWTRCRITARSSPCSPSQDSRIASRIATSSR